MSSYRSRKEQRKARESFQGNCAILAAILAVSALVYGAYAIDNARGITVSQSLDSAGL